MKSQDLFGNLDLKSSLNEYMLYFIGLGEEEVSIGEILEKMPHENDDIAEDLERLEEEGYLQTDEKAIYPVETTGFNDVLEETEYGEVAETTYSLDKKGRRYVKKAEIRELEDSLRNLMNR